MPNFLTQPARRRFVIGVTLAFATIALLWVFAWRRYVNPPAERNRKAVLTWLNRPLDMPYDRGYTLGTAIDDFYKRIGGRSGSGIGINFDLEGLERAKVSQDSPIRYSSRGLPIGQSLKEMLQPLGLGYFTEPNPYQPLLTITSLKDVAEHEALTSK